MELDDCNATAALRADAEMSGESYTSAGSKVTKELVGRYLGFLAEVGFLARPSGKMDAVMPVSHISKEQVDALRQLQGRGAVAP